MEDVTALVVQTIQRQLPDVPVYTEKMDEGGFAEPSFFVTRSNLQVIPQLGQTSLHTYRFNIYYFPNPERPNQDLDDMTAWLAANFKTIDMPATDVLPWESKRPQAYARVADQDFSVTDGVLDFTFRVRVRVTSIEALTAEKLSGSLNYKGGIKNGENNVDNQ